MEYLINAYIFKVLGKSPHTLSIHCQLQNATGLKTFKYNEFHKRFLDNLSEKI